MVVVDAWDFAAAVRDLDGLSPEVFRFGADILKKIFDALIARLLNPKPKRSESWMRYLYSDVVRNPTSFETKDPPVRGRRPRVQRP